jgi:hypothetical protein
MAKAATRTLPNVKTYARLAEESFARIVPLLPKKEQAGAGGTFALTDEDGIPYFGFRVGDPPLVKRQGRWTRAFEKCTRAAHGKAKTSRSTRNPTLDRWAGSLWADKSRRRGGFSGFPEDHDEIFVADVLVNAGDMSPAEAKRQLASNKTFKNKKVRRSFNWA